MKISFMTILICAVVCVPCFAGAPRIGSTVGSPTVPPSAYQQNLSPAGDYSVQYRLRNEMITGNVPGGQYFRGEVPYSSRYGFDGPLASDQINSFVRRSSITPYRGRYPLRYDPYYLPSRTISSLRRMGQLELVPPQVTFPGGTGRYQLPPTRQMYDPNPYRRRRLFERNISDLELKVLRQAQKENPDLYNITEGIRDDVAMDMLFKQQMEKIYQEKLSEKPTKDVYDTITEKPAELPKLLEPQEPLEPGMDQKLTEPSIEIDEQTQRDREIEELIEQLDQESTADDKAADDKSAEDQSRQQEFESSIPKMDHQTVLRMMYPYKTYKEYAKAKVNTYITLGDGFMKQGKFYKADDAYALALVYDFDSAQAYGGRGLALFAAGEYLTCVRYIEKALSLAPQYAKKKIDLKTFVGMEIIDKRLAHILKWYDSSKSPDFILLASYIYYHLGDLKMASESLDLAAEKMAGSAAIDAMRNAIKSAQTGKR